MEGWKDTISGKELGVSVEKGQVMYQSLVTEDSPVVQLLDYERRRGRNLQTGEEWDIRLPKSNVLQFILADGSKISARPSGTEPKIKFYFSVNASLAKASDFETVEKQLDDRITFLSCGGTSCPPSLQ